MGLRLVAHYFDPVDALIAQSVVDAAGMPSFLHGADLLSMQPFYVMGMGGYRLVVSEYDLEAAAAVLQEARANPNMEGERFESHASLADRVLSVIVGYLSGGAAMPIRRGAWLVSTDEGPRAGAGQS